MPRRSDSAPRRRTATVLCAAALLAGGCRGGEAPDGENAALANLAVTPTPSPVPAPLPVQLAPLGRAELLAAIRAAADARAAGAPLPEANRELVGRSFELALPFGCAGPGGEGQAAWAGWTFDAARDVLKLNARVPITEEAEWLGEIAPGLDFDNAEGFWIERPWTNSEACPPVLPSGADGTLSPETAAAAAPETAAIVEFFPPDAPRTRQRSGRPYAATLRADKVPADRSRGFALVLAGRIAGFADRQPVHCRVESADRPPVCAAAVEITHVAFRNAAGGEVLAEWDR